MIELRAATPADLELLRRWDEQPHVIASDPNFEWTLVDSVSRARIDALQCAAPR